MAMIGDCHVDSRLSYFLSAWEWITSDRYFLRGWPGRHSLSPLWGCLCFVKDSCREAIVQATVQIRGTIGKGSSLPRNEAMETVHLLQDWGILFPLLPGSQGPWWLPPYPQSWAQHFSRFKILLGDLQL